MSSPDTGTTTDSTKTNSSSSATSSASTSSDPSREIAVGDSGSALIDAHGKTSIADTVVAKIAGIAAREIDGVHDLGGAASRMVGRVREVIPGTTQNVTQGVSVEVGEKQAAVDLGLVAEYGVAIHQLAQAVRENVIGAISGMTGLEVTEVNIMVHDVHFADEDDDNDDSDRSEPRVQ